ncbi:hypothetical protein [Streptomyces yaizuensis]|uniref:Uncharacterized protein n=1 Tax=Streptomyces yaizuensis TaxID=2989713 RepID=A0ABQ5NZB1_9ACTN|nr:hypothetical protein [Streptomyces sp. YSPA8]GLF95572.1 hypothetical protein SYYSPA8_14765 [Streptomyces sp. YSPA8]
MADPRENVPLQTLVTQAIAVLLTCGSEVEPTAVRGVAARLVGLAAQTTGLDEEEAVHLVTPETVADTIMKSAADQHGGATSPHAVRPVRIDGRTVDVPVTSLGHLVMATAQAGKYAMFNGDSAAAAHLLDLATEIGAAQVKRYSDGTATVPVGMLTETADLVESVADRVETNGWSICPCDEDHGQRQVDIGSLPVMRHHAALARTLSESAAG